MTTDDDRTVLEQAWGPAAPGRIGVPGDEMPTRVEPPGNQADAPTVILPEWSTAVPRAATPPGIQRPPHMTQGAGKGGRPQTVPSAPAPMPSAGAVFATIFPQAPMLAAAAPLLLRLGNLRRGVASPPSPSRLAMDIAAVEAAGRRAGLPEAEVREAALVLSATADDVMRDLTGADGEAWRETGVAALRVGLPDATQAAFRAIESAICAPPPRARRLELMLVCLSLGLEGRYRHRPGGAVGLAEIRKMLRAALREEAPARAALSERWQPVRPARAPRRGLPLAVAATVGALMVLALYVPLAVHLSSRAEETERRMTLMHRDLPALTLVRPLPPEPPPPEREVVPSPPDQIERLRAGLAGQPVTVAAGEEWVLLRPGGAMSFASGRADPDGPPGAVAALAASIAAVLNAETGPVRVVGHSDSEPLSATLPHGTNLALSIARAQGFADLLTPHLDDPARLQVEGRGALEPVADNATPAGRAQNRRVEILLPRER